MLRLALTLFILSSLSACTWDDRPDGMAPSNAGDMVYEPIETLDEAEDVDLDTEGVTEPLDGRDTVPEALDAEDTVPPPVR